MDVRNPLKGLKLEHQISRYPNFPVLTDLD